MWVFLLVFLLVTAVWGTYLSYRLIRPLGLSPGWTLFLRLLMYLPMLIPMVYMLRRALDNAFLNQVLEVVVLTSLAYYSFLLGLSIFRDLAVGVSYLLGRLLHNKYLDFFGSSRVLRSSCLTIIGASTLMLFLGLYNALGMPAVKAVEVPIKELHPSLDGFQIVQLTDIHVDDLKREKLIREISAAVDVISPDLTVITGDLVDGQVETCAHLLEPFRDLPDNTFLITGNHEYYSGFDSWMDHFRTFHFRILLDQHELIRHQEARILIAGVTDPASENSFPDRPRGVEVAAKDAPPADFKILLAHQPGEIHDAEKFGFDLQLSGHTHGGQFFPWNYLVDLFHPYVRGLNRHGNMWIYVSQGTGFWGPPIRLGTRSEITLLTLKRED